MEVAALQPARQVVPLVEVLAVDGHAHLLRAPRGRSGWDVLGGFGRKSPGKRGLVMFNIG
jgi:hypothetical protein